MKRLAIVVTHPIQYYAPLFKLLQVRNRIEIMVFYTWGKQAVSKYDPGFDKEIHWDIPLLEGYNFRWMENIAKDPGTHHFRGIVVPGLSKDILAWNPDAILVFGWAWSAHLAALRYFKGKLPVYFRGDSTLLNSSSSLKDAIRTCFLSWVYRHVDTAFYVGLNNKEYYLKHGLKESALVFAPHAADNERFYRVPPEEGEALRTGLGIGNNEILVLFAGKFESVKNVQLLVEAFQKLGKKDVHLLLVGNGPLENVLKQIARQNKNIQFMDFQNQSAMPGIYQACDLFCLPSVSESWGLAVNEAMAVGRAILVSSKAGCAADLVKTGYNGAIFESGKIESLIAKLDELSRSKHELVIMGSNSKKIIKEWNFENIAMAIENTVNK